jgi:twinfilin-like protein
MPLDDDAKSAMEKLSRGDYGVVVLGIDVAREAMFLDTTAASGTKPDEVSGHISKTAPRYTFFAYTSQPEIKVLFIYTCPGVSKVKERMLYAANRNAVIHTVAPESGVKLEKRMEAGGPEDLDGGVVAEECGLPQSGESTAGQEASPAVSGAGAGRGFARPKRPGKK